ncbi:MAG: hypothetical protein M1836_006226 [Candelina mexicana]|nr:MAG: hypothetical protein M1836_006226 [Candelina mexicana]
MASKAVWAKVIYFNSLFVWRTLPQPRRVPSICRQSSNQSEKPENPKTTPKPEESNNDISKRREKTMAELDEELRQKLEGASGEGGAAGLELEDGKPVSMKRGVKNNMFRYI